MPLEDLLQNRHNMSRVVRKEVSPKSSEWGYQLGSVYIRKVHFRDETMIKQIEEKVANRLRQVTAAIRQAGDNQVEVIKSAAEKEAATEFARAATMRPRLVGEVMEQIANDPDVLEALLDILRIDRTIKSNARLTLIPANRESNLMSDLLAVEKPGSPAATAPAPEAQQPHQPAAGPTPSEQEPPVTWNPPTSSLDSLTDSLREMKDNFQQQDMLGKARTLVDAYKNMRSSGGGWKI